MNRIALAPLVPLVVVAAGLLAVSVGAQFNPNDPIRTPVLENGTLAATHLRFVPGTREQPHTHPFPIVIVQISPGEITVREGETIRRGGTAGEVWYVPSGRLHAVTTVATARQPVDLITVALLPTRQPAPASPVSEPPPGITRATLVDNNDVRVVRVRFAPDSREPLHTHLNDLLTIQISPGKIHIVNGADDRTEEHRPGDVTFVARNVPHWYASADSKPFELLSIAIK